MCRPLVLSGGREVDGAGVLSRHVRSVCVTSDGWSCLTERFSSSARLVEHIGGFCLFGCQLVGVYVCVEYGLLSRRGREAILSLVD